jgi:hypothetical protein
MAVLVNLVVLKIGWLCAVVGASHDIGWAWPLWSGLVLATYASMNRLRSGELHLILVACLAGVSVDTVMYQLGFVSYAAAGPIPGLAPAWIVGLWVLLATSMPRSLAWLVGRPVLAAIAGLALAPLSYWAGVSIGAAEFENGQTQGLIAVGLGWGVALPLLAEATRRLVPDFQECRSD